MNMKNKKAFNDINHFGWLDQITNKQIKTMAKTQTIYKTHFQNSMKPKFDIDEVTRVRFPSSRLLTKCKLKLKEDCFRYNYQFAQNGVHLQFLQYSRPEANWILVVSIKQF